MSLESTNETIEQTNRSQPPKIAKQLIVGIVVLAVLAVGVVAATSGKRIVETSTGCTATLSGSDVHVAFKGPHASSNCSEWIADFDGQEEGWAKRLGDRSDATSVVCSLTRDNDTARVGDGGTALIGSLACLSLETDGWRDTTSLDK